MHIFRRVENAILSTTIAIASLFVFGGPARAATSTPETVLIRGGITGLSFSGVSDSTPPNQSFSVSDTSPIGITFTTTKDQPWISIVSAATVDAPGNAVVIGVSTSGLAAGTYTGHVIITMPNQGGYTFTNSPYLLPVTLTVTSNAVTAPSITTQPSNKSVTAGQAATFTVAATGTAPMNYQWSKNSAAISGATSSAYTTPAETTADNNAKFTVLVSNSAGSTASNAAVLTVSASTLTPETVLIRGGITGMSFSGAAGSTLATQSFSVSDTSPTGMTFTTTKDQPWISIVSAATMDSPGNAVVVGVNTTGLTAGTYTGHVIVTMANQGGYTFTNSPYLLPVTLTVTSSTSSLILNSSPTSLSFGNVTVSNTSSQNVTLTNAGTSTVTISGVSVSGPGFNASGVASGLMLSAGKTATLSVTFDPAATGSASGSVTVSSNASNSPGQIALSGTGVTAVAHSVTLSWTASTSSVVGYYCYSSNTSGGPYAKLNSSPSTSTTCTDTTVQAGDTYYFVVTSVDSSNVESAYSSEVSATVP